MRGRLLTLVRIKNLDLRDPKVVKEAKLKDRWEWID